MKRIIRNYVVRDPKPILDSIIGGGTNYKSITFKPSIDGQVIFDNIINEIISDVDKTELYVNGIRYTINTDYEIENKKLRWIGDFDLKTSYDLVLITR